MKASEQRSREGHDNGGKPWVYREAKPYNKGNIEAVKHGGSSNKTIIPAEAAEMLESLKEELGLPWVERCDALALDLMTHALARWRRIDKAIEETEDILKVPDRLWQQVSREHRAILDALSKMGMTATDRAALMKDASWARALQGRSVQQLGDRGEDIRQKRLAQLPKPKE